ncbi:hypothetical protein [Silvibacterium acidisoli]|uniref:hypothetical protein n=1 Tax=Acidobacteriaceae bacterium ZG23-2 TaxID=2883246 RepID=UPI00406CD43C
MKWRPFKHGDVEYSLHHLNRCTIEFIVPPVSDKPERKYIVDVSYSLHCFTKGLPEDGAYDRSLLYSDKRESRLFDPRRYSLSQNLPGIVSELIRRYCMHTGHGNFFTVAILDENGQEVDYDIFFTVSKSSTKGRLNLYIQTAFVRERNKLPAGKPIRFEIILYNTLHGKKIRD